MSPFDRWHRVMQAPNLSPPEKATLTALACFAGEDGTGAAPSVATLAEYTSLTERTIYRALDGLTSRGLVVIEPRHNLSSRYTVKWSKMPERRSKGERRTKPAVPDRESPTDLTESQGVTVCQGVTESHPVPDRESPRWVTESHPVPDRESPKGASEGASRKEPHQGATQDCSKTTTPQDHHAPHTPTAEHPTDPGSSDGAPRHPASGALPAEAGRDGAPALLDADPRPAARLDAGGVPQGAGVAASADSGRGVRRELTTSPEATVYAAYRLLHPRMPITATPANAKGLKSILAECATQEAAIVYLQWVAEADDEYARQLRGKAPWPGGDIKARDDLVSLGRHIPPRLAAALAWDARGRSAVVEVIPARPQRQNGRPGMLQSLDDTLAYLAQMHTLQPMDAK